MESTSSLDFFFEQYVLNIELQNSSLHLKLAPSKPSSTPLYTYATQLDSEHIDTRLQFIFKSTQNIWKYISFYRQRALAIDLPRITVENQLLKKDSQWASLYAEEKKQIELPISIRLIVMEDIQAFIPLTGQVTVETVQKRLTKSLTQNQELKQKLSSIQAYVSSLEQKILELKKIIHSYEMERPRVDDQIKPKKRVHFSHDFEENQNPDYQSEPIQKFIQPQSGEKMTQFEKNICCQNPQQTLSNQGSKNFNAMDASSIIDQALIVPNNAEESKMNVDIVDQSQIYQQKLCSNPINERDIEKSQVLSNGSKKIPNTYQKIDKIVVSQTAEEKAIAEFAQKCHLFVGFNDKGEERLGFVCIVCTKAFKDVAYLEKHLLTKHEDFTKGTQTELEVKLAQYKQRKDKEMKLDHALNFYAAK